MDRFDQLSKLLIGLFATTDPIEDKQRRAEEILEEYFELNAKFHKNKLYFSEETYSLLTAYKYTIFEPAMVLLENRSDTDKELFMKEYIGNFSEKNMHIEKLRASIEKEFRALLGVTNK